MVPVLWETPVHGGKSERWEEFEVVWEKGKMCVIVPKIKMVKKESMQGRVGKRWGRLGSGGSVQRGKERGRRVNLHTRKEEGKGHTVGGL